MALQAINAPHLNIATLVSVHNLAHLIYLHRDTAVLMFGKPRMGRDSTVNQLHAISNLHRGVYDLVANNGTAWAYLRSKLAR